MKTNANKKTDRPQLPTTERLGKIWEKVLADIDAREALKQLGKAGFPIADLKPNDGSFVRPSWADYISAVPLLPAKPSTRRIHHVASSRKYLPLVQELREFAEGAGPFGEVQIFSSRDYPVTSTRTLREDLLKAASTLEHFLSWNYSVRHVNPRQALIAELRWTIRFRTGRPHDRELNILLDAAFRAAGHEQGYYINPGTLDRIEKRQRESRTKISRKFRGRM